MVGCRVEGLICRVLLVVWAGLTSGLIVELRSLPNVSYEYDHATASFGASPGYNITGPLALTNLAALDLCETLVGIDLSGQVAAFAYQNCAYADQVVHAMRAGAAGVVVAGSDSGDTSLVTMGCNEDSCGDCNCSSVTVPVVYISGQSFADIQSQLAAQGPMRAILNATGETDPNPPPPREQITFFLLVLLIIPIAWCIMVAITLVFRICSRIAQRHMRAREVRRLPDIPYTRIEEGELGAVSDGKQMHNDRCAICLEDFAPGERIKVLPCRHGFHGECIDPWLSERSDTCPMCKQSVHAAQNDAYVCCCVPVACCQRCCLEGNLSPRATQMIMLVVVTLLAVIIALFFVIPI